MLKVISQICERMEYLIEFISMKGHNLGNMMRSVPYTFD